MFVTTVFTIAGKRDQLRCPSTEWIMKYWFIHTIEYYSALKKIIKNSILLFIKIIKIAGKQLDLDFIILRRHSDSER